MARGKFSKNVAFIGIPRVLYVSTPVSWRGGEQQLMYLMEEMYKNNRNFALICPEGSALYKATIKKQFRLFSYGSRGIMGFNLARQIAWLCNRHHYNIVHVNDSHAHTASIIATWLGCRAHIIVHRRVDFPTGKSPFTLYKYNHKRIKAVVCISEEVKRVLWPSIRDKERIKVVTSGIDLQRFENVEPISDIRKNFNIPADSPVVAMIAALAPHKDYPTFVRTACEVVSKYPQVYFLAIGEGALRDSILKMINQTGYGRNIILTGFINNIPAVLHQVDVFLLTSKTEGLGTTIIDAFACEKPVVATNAGGIPELVIHRKNGLLSEVGDHHDLARNIELILTDAQLANGLVRNAKQMVSLYTREVMGKNIIELYNQIIG